MSVQKTDITQSPFEKAASSNKRLKLFLWGDSGVGKTTLSLQFPNVAVIDLEGGTDHYGDSYNFDVLKASTADEITAAVDWLLHNPHKYKTVVLDPFTMYWDALLKKYSDIFMRRNKSSKGYKHEFYDMQAKDWSAPKSELKEFIRKLIRLDMNVIVTARQKAQYADSGFMRVVGQTFDGEKSLPYLFDTIIRQFRDEKGRFMGECLKDRSQRLPLGEFEISYKILEEYLGGETFNRQATPLKMITTDQLKTLQQHITDFGMSEAQVAQRLAVYGADSLGDLTEDTATLIINKFEQAATANSSTAADESTTQPKETNNAID